METALVQKDNMLADSGGGEFVTINSYLLLNVSFW